MTPAMYGWRARIGLILPADNVLMEPELNGLNIPGVSFHGLRITATDHDEMRKQGVELAGTIEEMGLDAVVYACAETSFNGGSGVRRTLSELIASECKVPVVTATNAMLAALEHVGAKRVAVLTPYKPRSGEQFEETIREAGLTVTSSAHRDFSLESTDPREWFATNRQPPSTVYAMARRVDTPDADALVIAATNLPTLGIVYQLEEDIRKPVVTSNQSILWWCMRTLGVSIAGVSLGALISERVARGNIVS